MFTCHIFSSDVHCRLLVVIRLFLLMVVIRILDIPAVLQNYYHWGVPAYPQLFRRELSGHLTVGETTIFRNTIIQSFQTP